MPLYYDLRDLALTDTYWALILPQVAHVGRVRHLLDARVLPLRRRARWSRRRGSTARRAGRRSGASLLPLGRPAMLTMVVLIFMWTWNEFLLALVMVSDEGLRTAPLGLAFFQGRNTTDYALLAAGSVIVATPVVLALRGPAAPLHPRHARRGGEGLMAAVTFRDGRQALRRRSRPCASSRSRSPTASSWCSSGPSGSGKTTALRMLAGLEAVTAGTIAIGDRVVNDVAPRRARHRDGVPGLRAVPADVGARQLRLRAAPAQGRARRDRAARAARPPRRSSSASCSTGARASSPAASSSASRSGARSCASRRCS